MARKMARFVAAPEEGAMPQGSAPRYGRGNPRGRSVAASGPGKRKKRKGRKKGAMVSY